MGPNVVNLAERHGRGFVIKLAGLRQVGLAVFEVIHFEQRGGAFAGRGREDGRIHQREAVRIEIVAHRPDHFVAHADDGVLPLAAQPQVPMVHQEFDAVILGRDGIRIGLRHALHHFQIFHVHLVAAGGALFGADLAGDDDGRFLGQVFDGFEQRFRQRALHRHALHQAGAVAHDGEHDLAGLAQVVKPAGDLYGFAGVLRGFGDGNSRSVASQVLQIGRKLRLTVGQRMRIPAPLSIPAAADTGPRACAAGPWSSSSRWCRLRPSAETGACPPCRRCRGRAWSGCGLS